jgi:hypothetical protein
MFRSRSVLEFTVFLYRLILALYPRRFRREYGDDMLQLFRDMAREAWRERGLAGIAVVGLRTINDLALSVSEQYARGCQHAVAALPRVFSRAFSPWTIAAQTGTLALLVVPLAIVSSSAFAKVDLTLKHVEGSVTAYRTTTRTHQVLTINDIPYETAGESTTTTRVSVGARRPDGTLPIRNRIESIEAKLRLPGGIDVTFDSAAPESGTENSQAQVYFHLFRALSGSSHTAVLDRDNHVIAARRDGDGFDGAPDSVKEMFRDEFDPDYLKQVSSQELRRLPEVPVKQGDTWARNEIVGLGGGQLMTFTTRYEYLGTLRRDGETLDQIGATSLGVAYRVDPTSPLPLQVRHSDFKIQSSEGTLLFDRLRGLVVEAQRRDHIQGELTMVINGVDSPSIVDLTIETRTWLVDLNGTTTAQAPPAQPALFLEPNGVCLR